MFLLTQTSFVYVFHSVRSTKESLGNVSNLAFFQNTNRLIWYIIYEILTNVLLTQRFEMTVIKKFMFCLTDILFIYEWTWAYVHSIINSSKNISGTPLFYFYGKHWCHNHKFLSHEELSISFIFVSFTPLGGHRLYN